MWATFGAAGATLYVSGGTWATFPAIQYPAGGFAAPYVRFYLGDAYGGGAAPLTVTVHDIQLYDRALAPADVAALARGIETLC